MSIESSQIEEPPRLTAEEFLEQQRSSIRKKSIWAIAIGAVIVVLHVVGFLFLFLVQEEIRGESDEPLSWKLLFRSIFFVLAIVAIGGGLWGLSYAKRLTLDDLVPSPEAIAFAREAQAVTPYYTYFLVGCIVVVTLVQLATGLERSIEIAGFDKREFAARHEYWRILTGAVLHGGLLHIYFNSQAFYGFGHLIEFLSNRAHLPVVFLLSALGGGALSLAAMPGGISVGASGGIMGLIGYMAVYGYRRRRQLPPGFLKSMLVNIGFIAAIGVIGYQFIDNFAHLGGLIVGVIYGVVQVPADLHSDPRRTGTVALLAGVISLAVIAATSVFAVILILDQ